MKTMNMIFQKAKLCFESEHNIINPTQCTLKLLPFVDQGNRKICRPNREWRVYSFNNVSSFRRSNEDEKTINGKSLHYFLDYIQ